MKEIDFLPEWYKSGRRRQYSYRTQCIALVGIFLIMLVWNFTASYSISKAEAEIGKLTPMQLEAQKTFDNLEKIRNQMTSLREKVTFIEQIDSNIDVASVLAELSFLLDNNIVLSKVQFLAERFGDKSEKNTALAVRVAPSDLTNKQAPPIGDVRFKVIISGIAASAADVAVLICKLEDSPYFCQVIPSFSRNKKIRTDTGSVRRLEKAKETASEDDKGFQVSEFEISCYLANYHQQ